MLLLHTRKTTIHTAANTTVLLRSLISNNGIFNQTYMFVLSIMKNTFLIAIYNAMMVIGD